MNTLNIVLSFLELRNFIKIKETKVLEIQSRSATLYRLTFKTKNFALKILKSDNFHSDLYFYTKFKNTKVPVPQVYFYDETKLLISLDWFVMDWIVGNNKYDSDLLLGEEIGKILYEVHSVKTNGAGKYSLVKGREFEYIDWYECVNNYLFKNKIKELNNWFNKEDVKLLIDVIHKFKNVAIKLPNLSFLLHGDLGLDNLIINKGKVIGLIDTGKWINAGHPLMDISYFFNSNETTSKMIEGFKKGYNQFNNFQEFDIHIFQCYQLLGKLSYSIDIDNMKRYKNKLNQLMQIYNKL